MKVLRTCERYFTPAGRIIIGAFFVLAGISKVFDIAGTAAYIESVGLPMSTILALLGIVIEIGFGGMLLVGYKAQYAALCLAIFTLIVSVLFHGPGMWSENPMQQMFFMKNMAIMGGLLFIAAHIGAPCCGVHRSSTEPTPTL